MIKLENVYKKAFDNVIGENKQSNDYKENVTLYVNDVKDLVELDGKEYSPPVSLHNLTIPDIRGEFGGGSAIKIKGEYLILALEGAVGSYKRKNGFTIHATRQTIGGVGVRILNGSTYEPFVDEEFKQDIVKFFNLIRKKTPNKEGFYDLSVLVKHKDWIISRVMEIINA